MIKLLCLFLLLGGTSFAQIGMGQWRLHVPANRAIDVVANSTTVFAAYESGLIEYDKESHEISEWNAVNGLSDVVISEIDYSSSRNTLIIGFENGNIDLLKGSTVVNVPSLKIAEVQGDKKIYNIYLKDRYAYISCGLGVVVLDLDKDEVKESYYPGGGLEPIIDFAMFGDSLYALTKSKLFSASASSPLLADPLSWKQNTMAPTIVSTAEKLNDIEVSESYFYISKIHEAYGGDSVFNLSSSGLIYLNTLNFDVQLNSVSSSVDRIVVNTEGAIFAFQGNSFLESKYAPEYWMNPLSSYHYDDTYWIADGTRGLLEFKGYSPNIIENIGPPKDQFYKLDWEKGVLAVAGGGLADKGVTFNSAGIYVFKEEEWTLKDRYNMDLWKDKLHWDCISVSVNPTNTNQIAVGTYSVEALSLLDADGQVTAVFNASNSPIDNTSLGNGWAEISDLEYDSKGNLWIMNGYTNEPLKVYTKDGNWYSYSAGPASKNNFSWDMLSDYEDNHWFSINGKGVFGYDHNGTLDNTSDDAYVQLTTDPNGGALPSNLVTALAVDFDNELWIGTDNGFAVLYNAPSSFTTSDNVNASRIKTETDGLVDYVLGGTYITDIEVDGGNRKWIGTANSGLVLLSADGLEILEHFTKDNSPLISDAILDIEIDHNSGEVFIITDGGLISYRSDASYAKDDYSDVNIFPNPARPDFEGPITIQGIKYDSDVKITDAAGNVVFKTTSNGGTATWNGNTLSGQPVASGVYLIWTAPNEGKGHFVGKVAIIN